MVSAFGSTESAPLITGAHWLVDRPGNVGNVTPGAEVKLAAHESKLEIRGRGPNITPGYLGRPELTEAAFDEDGFFRFGDAMRLEDESDASKGMLFDGRVAEDFKLASGTWVHPGVLRPDLIAAAAPPVPPPPPPPVPPPPPPPPPKSPSPGEATSAEPQEARARAAALASRILERRIWETPRNECLGYPHTGLTHPATPGPVV